MEPIVALPKKSEAPPPADSSAKSTEPTVARSEADSLTEAMAIFRQKQIVRAPAPTRLSPNQFVRKAATPEELERAAVQYRSREDNERAERIAILVKSSGIEPRYERATFDDQEIPRAALSAAQFQQYQMVADQLRSAVTEPCTMVMRGQNGPGKTFLASALVLESCRRLQRSKYATAFDFLLAIRSTFNESGHTQEDLIKKWTSFKTLVIDEFEVRNNSPWEDLMFRNLFTKRDAALLTTLIITNKSKQELAEYLPNSLLSRLYSDQLGGLLNCDWADLRGRSSMNIQEQNIAGIP